MKLLTVLLSLSLNSTLLAGSLPAKVTPTWDKQTIPGNVLTSPIAPVAIVGGEGKSVNVPHTLTVDLPEKLDAQSCYALRFRALFVRQGEPGFRHALASEVNGKELNMLTATGNFRLMNRGEYQPQSWQRGYRQTMPWFSARHYPVILAKYRPPEQAADDWEYVFDVTDLIHAGKNEITLRHAGSVGDKRCELRVRELAIVQYDPAQIQRAQAPIIRSVADKARFLSSLCPADSALRQAPTPQKWLEHIRTRTPRILTPRSSKITAKTKLNNYDKIRADGALKNLIYSPIPGYQPIQYSGNVDYLTNQVQHRNPDWLAQHNRLGVMWALATAYRCTGEERYAASLVRHLDHWCDVAERNYAPGGLPIWDSLSSGVRAKVLCEIIDILIDYPQLPAETLTTVLFILQRHGDYLYHSGRTPGNWGITEAEGLAYAAMYLPELAESNAWAQRGLGQLQAEFAKQVHPDGMHQELTWGYHYYGINWFYSSSEMVSLNQRKDLEKYSIPLAKLEKMYEIVAACLHPDLRWSAWGDAADEPGLGKMRHAAALFPNNPYFAFWAHDRGTPPKLFHHFVDSGFYSVRSSWQPNAVHLLVKNGPNGGWHCHFDNGTFEFFAYGRNLTPDTGNYTYNHSEGRDWFLATSRHQTLTLDDKNSDFAPSHLQAEHTEKQTFIGFENQSYPGLKHQRRIAFLRGKYLVIVDDAIGTANGNCAIHFQTAPGADLQLDQVTQSARTTFASGANLAIVPLRQTGLKAQLEPGKKANTGKQIPRPAIRYEVSKKAAQNVRFVTALIPIPGKDFPRITLREAGANCYRLEVGNEVFELTVDPVSGKLQDRLSDSLR